MALTKVDLANTVEGILPVANGGTGQTTAVIPSGSVFVLYQASAPTGWTQVTTLNDYAIRIVSGSGGTTGGSVAFSTAFTSQAVSGSVSTSVSGGAVGGYTLTVADIPSHNHLIPDWVSGNTVRQYGGGFAAQGSFNANSYTSSVGGGGAHSHPFTQPTASSSFTGTAINLAVQYANHILCSKN